MIRLSDGRLLATGREAADHDLATRRRQITLRNQLAAAVRVIANQDGPVARLEIGRDPFGIDTVKDGR